MNSFLSSYLGLPTTFIFLLNVTLGTVASGASDRATCSYRQCFLIPNPGLRFEVAVRLLVLFCR